MEGKAISMSEARRIALDVLAEAEECRIRYAQGEANHSAVWEEVSKWKE